MSCNLKDDILLILSTLLQIVTCKEKTHDIIDNDGVPGKWSILLAHVIRVIDGSVVDHGGDHKVDVDPQRVVEHKPNEGEKTEDIADGEPAGACETLHLDSLTVDNILITSKYSI